MTASGWKLPVPSIDAYYRYWTTDPHLTRDTGLSRYFDLLAPARLRKWWLPSTTPTGRNDYDLIRDYFRTHKVTDYDVFQYYDAKKDQLTPLFYQGDRFYERIRLRSLQPVWAFQHRHHSLRSSVLEFAALSDGDADRRHHGPVGPRIKSRQFGVNGGKARSAQMNRLMWDQR